MTIKLSVSRVTSRLYVTACHSTIQCTPTFPHHYCKSHVIENELIAKYWTILDSVLLLNRKTCYFAHSEIKTRPIARQITRPQCINSVTYFYARTYRIIHKLYNSLVTTVYLSKKKQEWLKNLWIYQTKTNRLKPNIILH